MIKKSEKEEKFIWHEQYRYQTRKTKKQYWS